MIVPLEVKIDVINRAQDYETEFHGAIPYHPQPPTYRVRAAMLDLERELVIEYEFHSMVDPTQPAGQEVGTINHTAVERHRKYLRKLRDQLDRALGEL